MLIFASSSGGTEIVSESRPGFLSSLKVIVGVFFGLTLGGTVLMDYSALAEKICALLTLGNQLFVKAVTNSP